VTLDVSFGSETLDSITTVAIFRNGTFSDSFKNLDRALIADVAGIQSGGRLKQHYMRFLFGHRAMLYAARNNKEITLFHPDEMVAKFHPEAARYDKEQLVLIVMMMPHKWAVEFHQFYQLAVEFAHDFGLPIFAE